LRSFPLKKKKREQHRVLSISTCVQILLLQKKISAWKHHIRLFSIFMKSFFIPTDCLQFTVDCKLPVSIIWQYISSFEGFLKVYNILCKNMTHFANKVESEWPLTAYPGWYSIISPTEIKTPYQHGLICNISLVHIFQINYILVYNKNIKTWNMAFSISAWLSFPNQYQPTLDLYGGLWMITRPIWKKSCFDLYLFTGRWQIFCCFFYKIKDIWPWLTLTSERTCGDDLADIFFNKIKNVLVFCLTVKSVLFLGYINFHGFHHLFFKSRIKNKI
jgi:hypothetical protein